MTALPLPCVGNHIVPCHIQQVLPTKHPQPLHCGQEISLPPRWHCSIKSSSNAKDDSCGVALRLFSILPSWGLTPDLLVKVTDNTAMKDLVLILMFITECWTRGKWAGWVQRHMYTDTLLDAVLTHLLWCPERLEKQESCKKFTSQGYPLHALACIHKHMDCAGIGLDNSNSSPEQLSASIFCSYLPSPFRSCENLSNRGRRKRTNLPFIWAWDFPTRAAHIAQCQYI